MSSWCSGATCGASELMSWADNPNPVTQTYRAEIEHNATGAVVATETVVVDLLPFWFDASLAFAVINGRNRAVATATPNPNGSSYSVLIRRLDGTQVCNTWLDSYSSCRGAATVGQTYRATVENNRGHIAGRSSWWTFTATGPRGERADDLDLIGLAALYAAPGTICSHVLLYPGTHLGGSSVSDQYLACEAAVQQGKTTLEVLRAIVAAGGGTAILWYLHERVTEDTTTHDPSDDEDVGEPTPIPPPIAWPDTLQEDVDQLIAQNPQLDRPTAATVLKTCVRYVLRAGLTPSSCLNLPIFASGDLDVPEPTEHDRESISVRPHWVLLNYELGTGKPGRGWYDGTSQCPSPRPDGQQCHEYPFFATKQGGPDATPLPRVKLVAAGQNLSQGGAYSVFARECLHQVDNTAFLSVPVPEGSGIPTLRICN